MGLPQNDLFASKHNPSFVDRTLATRLEIEDLLSSMRRQLAMIVITQDEHALEDLCMRVKGAGNGFMEKKVIPAKRAMLSSGDVWYHDRRNSTDASTGMEAQIKVGMQEVDESAGRDEGGKAVGQ